jgi:hypothetical protein
MQGEVVENYNDGLCSNEAIKRDLESPDDAFLPDPYDILTLDRTIIAALGQLLVEGRIDAEAKPYEREADQSTTGQSLAKHARPSFIAFLEHSNGLPIDQECPYCQGAIWVEDRERSWTVRCPCGRCTNSFRGL